MKITKSKYDYIGAVYKATRKDPFFTGKTEVKYWRILVDKAGNIYTIEWKKESKPKMKLMKRAFSIS